MAKKTKAKAKTPAKAPVKTTKAKAPAKIKAENNGTDTLTEAIKQLTDQQQAKPIAKTKKMTFSDMCESAHSGKERLIRNLRGF